MERYHDEWNTKNPDLKTNKKNFIDSGLLAAVLQAYKSTGKKAVVEKTRVDSIRRYLNNLRNPKARKDYYKKTKDNPASYIGFCKRAI